MKNFTKTAAVPMNDEALVVHLENLQADQLTDELIAAWEEANARLEAKRLERERAMAQAAKTAAQAQARMAMADEVIANLEKELRRRKQEAFAAKIGPVAVEALARIKACLENGNDGGVVAAYYDFKKKSKWREVQLPVELGAKVKEAFARYDGRK